MKTRCVARNGLRLAAEHRAGTGRRGTAPSRPALAPRTKCARVTTTHNGQPPGASPADTLRSESRDAGRARRRTGGREATWRSRIGAAMQTSGGSRIADRRPPRTSSRAGIAGPPTTAGRPGRRYRLCPDRWAARARARVSAHRPARNHRHSAIASQFPRATPAGHARYRRESALYPKPGLPRYPIYYRGRIVACVYSERDHIDSILIYSIDDASARNPARARARRTYEPAQATAGGKASNRHRLLAS